MLFFVFILFGVFRNRVLPELKGKQLWEEETVELGDSLSEDPSFYVAGNGWVMDHTRIDISDVNDNTVGDYEIRALSPFGRERGIFS